MNGLRAVVHPLVCADDEPVLRDPDDAGSLPLPVARIDAAQEVLAAARAELGEFAASEEAVAVLLRRQGVALEAGVPELVSRKVYLRRVHEWGRASVAVQRARPDLLSELAIGAWARPDVAARLRRGVALRVPRGAIARIHPRTACEAAFWRGVRGAATSDEWRRLTATYSALVYHRLAGEGVRGQERVDMPPETFHRHLRALVRCRIRILDRDELVSFHRGEGTFPGRRRTVVTIDDATSDVVQPLSEVSHLRPQLFAVTASVGGTAEWLDGVELAGWDDLRRLASRGVIVGAHTRSHPHDLTALSDRELENEVAGSRRDLAAALGEPPALFAYPHGRLDARVRGRVADAGYELAYSTLPGLNGAGTDPLALRRVSAKA
ncbi:MAG TPA: polysaccharide deacetylase family protein, partial [Gaiellaceae bacterium]|nr:polysaccharide deacetylase family protein [Gaiellaceae bacterium]